MTTYFESFIETLPPEQKDALKLLRKHILEVVPEAEEGISSGVPAFKYKGKYLASINATQNHLALYMMQGKSINAHKDILGDYDITNVAVRFTVSNPLRMGTVRRLITTRVQEIDQKYN